MPTFLAIEDLFSICSFALKLETRKHLEKKVQFLDGKDTISIQDQCNLTQSIIFMLISNVKSFNITIIKKNMYPNSTVQISNRT